MSKDDLIAEIGRQLRLLQRSFDTFDEAAAAHLRLNRTDLRCLDVVSGSDSSTPGELARELKLSPAATTTVVDRLVRAGLVTRAPDPANRRRVLVAPTDAARAAATEIFEPVAVAGAEALARYDTDQLAVVLDFLHTALDVHHDQTMRLVARQAPPDADDARQ
ncbi:MarR family winged helix-turn-helix transcriptional regulator [Nocardia farcinica]|uniref:MarR family winged helix-turn-helix transcriptional regulator n=1 Tax=Nocardia farcinica TaxID=37329 RepID=UPI00245784B9|nr:MarR family transcriptional regulator [Nocardia farcinica]